jgi:uncharacterized membrane protein (DUF441 family)
MSRVVFALLMGSVCGVAAVDGDSADKLLAVGLIALHHRVIFRNWFEAKP